MRRPTVLALCLALAASIAAHVAKAQTAPGVAASDGPIAQPAAKSSREEPTWTLRQLDKDGDGRLSRAEFVKIGRDTFGGWDINQNNRIEGIEFSRSLFANWDANRDERLSPEEFSRAAAFWDGLLQGATFAQWDSNRDGTLALTEFRAGLSASGLFARWDADGSLWLSAEELEAGLFALWDRDGDGVVAEGEFKQGNAVAWF